MARTPVTSEQCDHVAGPFLHGTEEVSTAAWGAQLAVALAGLGGDGRVHVVEPTGPFEDDPDVTDEEFPGNPTGSYRTRRSARRVSEARLLPGP